MTARRTEPSLGIGGAVREDNPWLLVSILGLIYTCAFLDRHVIALLIDPIRASFGISDVEVSLLMGFAFSTFYSIMVIPGGVIIDRVGRRGLIGSATFVWSVMTILCGSATSFWQFFLGRAGLGIAEVFITPSAFSLIRDRVPPELHGRAFSIFAAAPYVGSAAAMIGGGALLDAATAGTFNRIPLLASLPPWQVVLVILGTAGLPLGLLTLLLRPDRRGAADTGTANGFGAVWRHARPRAATYVGLVGYVTTGAMLAFGSIWVPVIMARKFALSLGEVGFAAGMIELCMALPGLFLCGFIIDRMRQRRGAYLNFAIACSLLTAAGIALLPFMPTATGAWLCYGVAMFFAGAFYSIGATLLSEVTPSELMGKTTAIYLVFQTMIGASLGPTLVAVVGEMLFPGPRAIELGLSVYSATTGVLSACFIIQLRRVATRS